MTYLDETITILAQIDRHAVDEMTARLRNLDGRLFVLGLGGSAAHASHAVNDFRKIAGIEAYTPLDNVAELTAHINDECWGECLVRYLQGSRFSERDALLVFSVGGGTEGVSLPLIAAVAHAHAVGATVLGITGPDGGYTAQRAEVCIRIPAVENVTPQVEGITAVLWHAIVTALA